jgi:glycosyltransferase involved in cell wall biosynthesis
MLNNTLGQESQTGAHVQHEPSHASAANVIYEASARATHQPNTTLRVLLVIEQCNPEWASVPLEGYRWFQELQKLAHVTLVTHERNQPALDKLNGDVEIVYIQESWLIKQYYQQVINLTTKGRVIWPLLHALAYPMFAQFNRRAYRQCRDRIRSGEFDLIHVVTPMEPRYPTKMVEACAQVPLLLGPVNGGVPFPKGFAAKARAEFSYLNFLRTLGRMLIPGYVKTYKRADRILAGSTYTLNLVKDLFKLSDDQVRLLYENGIPESFLQRPRATAERDRVNLLFVGRLVPYKSADILLNALARLDQSVLSKLHLSIVGDGSERETLEALCDQLGLRSQVTFTGWVSQTEIVNYYGNADVFCFPSIREYGGAVVLEAMASGLPCIVANNGGIGEYVTEDNGFRIEPISPEYLTQELTCKIQLLVEDASLRQRLSNNARQRAAEFTWPRKAQAILNHYHELVAARR